MDSVNLEIRLLCPPLLPRSRMNTEPLKTVWNKKNSPLVCCLLCIRRKQMTINISLFVVQLNEVLSEMQGYLCYITVVLWTETLHSETYFNQGQPGKATGTTCWLVLYMWNMYCEDLRFKLQWCMVTCNLVLQTVSRYSTDQQLLALLC